MLFFVVLVIFSVASMKSVASEKCELPEQLVGEWSVSVEEGWKEPTIISNTTVSAIRINNQFQDFTCFLNNGSTYVLESPPKQINAAGLMINYYMCLDIVPFTSSSDTSPYLVFFYLRTAKNQYANDQPFHPLSTNEEKTLEGICDYPSAELPVNYTYFLRKDYETLLGNETCPSSLQAEFSVNFTDDTEYRKCPGGFNLNGCDLSHLFFNFTDCDGGDQGTSGSSNFTCLASVEKDNVIYTIVHLQEDAQQEKPNPYQYSCMAHQKDDQDPMTITKSAGTCGGTPSVTMEAEETVSCRSEPTTEAPTTPAGSENGTQASNTSTPSTQGPGTGDGEHGGGGSSTVSWGVLSFLIPGLVTAVLVAVKM